MARPDLNAERSPKPSFVEVAPAITHAVLVKTPNEGLQVRPVYGSVPFDDQKNFASFVRSHQIGFGQQVIGVRTTTTMQYELQGRGQVRGAHDNNPTTATTWIATDDTPVRFHTRQEAAEIRRILSGGTADTLTALNWAEHVAFHQRWDSPARVVQVGDYFYPATPDDTIVHVTPNTR